MDKQKTGKRSRMIDLKFNHLDFFKFKLKKVMRLKIMFSKNVVVFLFSCLFVAKIIFLLPNGMQNFTEGVVFMFCCPFGSKIQKLILLRLMPCKDSILSHQVSVFALDY